MYRLCLGLLVSVLGAIAGCSGANDSAPKFDYGAAKAQKAPEGTSQPQTKPQQDWVTAVLRERDKNHDGYLDFEEFTNTQDPHFRRVETAVFKLADRNKDGRLSKEELRNLPPEAGFLGLDLNDDGTLDFREFYLGELKGMPINQARRIFQAVDQNKDGKISCDEFLHRPKEVEFLKLDTNCDGRLSFEEFAKGKTTPAAIAGAKLAFKKMDLDHDGYISLTEYLKWPGWDPEVSFVERDQNQDGVLDLEEFLSLCPEGPFRRMEADVFKLCDRNHDGKLTLDEMMNMPPEVGHRHMDSDGDGFLSLAEFTAGSKELSADVARRVFQVLDRNGDGKLSPEEFVNRPVETTFYILDIDGDGRLSQDEFDKGHPELVRSGRNRERFRMRDINKDGYLSLKEFLYDPADADFWSMDKDGDGYVSLEEFLASSPTGEEKKTPTQGKVGEKVASKANQGGRAEEKKGSPAANGLSAAFANMDLNHDGKLSLTEFRAARPRPPEDWVKRAFWERDKNRDGYLDFDEFTDTPDPHFRRVESDVFRLADRNKDGKLSEGELRNMPPEVGYRHLDLNDDGNVDFEEFRAGELSGLSLRQARRVFQVVDQNGDGKISCEEYLHRPREVEFFKLDTDCDDRLSFAEYSKGSSTPAAIAAAKSAFQELDLDHDGYLTLKEFLYDPADADFWSMDKNGDGYVSLEEFLARSQAAGEKKPPAQKKTETKPPSGTKQSGKGEEQKGPLPANAQRAKFASMDLNHDGKLSLTEFRLAKKKAAAK